MSHSVVRINKIGIVSSNLEKSVKTWERLMGVIPEGCCYSGVTAASFPVGKSSIELVKPEGIFKNMLYEKDKDNYCFLELAVDNVSSILEELKTYDYITVQNVNGCCLLKYGRKFNIFLKEIEQPFKNDACELDGCVPKGHLKISKINHISIAISDVERVLPFWKWLLQVEPFVYDEPWFKMIGASFSIDGVNLSFNQSTDIGRFHQWVQAHGESIHHSALQVDNIIETKSVIERWEGFSTVENEPLSGLKGAHLFLEDDTLNGVKIELFEVHKKVPDREDLLRQPYLY